MKPYDIFFLVLLICIAPIFTLSQTIDILLKGGHLIDPKNKIDAKMDVAITAGKISGVAVGIPVGNAKKVIDVSGMYVTPGIIDMHAHAFHGVDGGAYIANGFHSLPPDGFTFRAGVTTIVDAGSSGWKNFRLFKTQTIDKSKTRVLAFLNIVGSGMYGRLEEQDVSDMNPEMTAYMITHEFPDIIVGIKSAHYWGDFTQVDLAVKAGQLAGVPVMVDFGEHHPPNSIEELFMKHLRPGDIFTHTYANGFEDRETVVDRNGKVKPFVFTAQQRGINFDVGHGGGAFSWIQAVPSIQQKFWPNTISTDLHTESMNGGMKDMSNVMSKFLAMGMPLKDVVLRSTWNPANVINRKELGNLDVGSEADVAVFSLREGNFGYLDVRGIKVKGKQKLETELTLRAGKIVWDLNGIAATEYNGK
ncbi:MAG TPA: amidohydrolase/deacetylase family metallohydrolase [Agriterribacter sp.]|nr:amidohydrolase/deacetylase family metallohydrolase [Agriterribacter sp.]